MKKIITIGVLLLAGNMGFSSENLDGTWKLENPRHCLNQNKITDTYFHNALITEYKWEINKNSLHQSFIIGQTNIEIEYDLIFYDVENGSLIEARPISNKHSASTFQIIKNEKDVLVGLFDDNENKFCDGGFILTTMKRSYQGSKKPDLKLLGLSRKGDGISLKNR